MDSKLFYSFYISMKQQICNIKTLNNPQTEKNTDIKTFIDYALKHCKGSSLFISVLLFCFVFYLVGFFKLKKMYSIFDAYLHVLVLPCARFLKLTWIHKYAFLPFYIRLPPYKFSISIVPLAATQPIYRAEDTINASPHLGISVTQTRYIWGSRFEKYIKITITLNVSIIL